MIFSPRRELIRHLQAEVAYWRLQFEHERQRAEEAINRLLEQKMIAPLEAAPPRSPRRDLTDMVEELVANPEFSQAGEAG